MLPWGRNPGTETPGVPLWDLIVAANKADLLPPCPLTAVEVLPGLPFRSTFFPMVGWAAQIGELRSAASAWCAKGVCYTADTLPMC